jgi:tRNA pseudouridine32 synthase / 23S rRNA pseudouridine746 synthase
VSTLWALSDFIAPALVESDEAQVVDYWYSGRCPQTGELLKLPRTALAKAIAQGLMAQLQTAPEASNEGKMYGILLVESAIRELHVLKAFSGLLQGQPNLEGWVPAIPGRDQVVLAETQTLQQLEAIKQELLTLKFIPQRQQLEQLRCDFEQQLQAMSDRHRQRKQQRQQERLELNQTLTEPALSEVLAKLNTVSQQDGIERRRFKQQRDLALEPLKLAIAAADSRIQELKQRRRTLSQQLQAQMHAVYVLTNFSGQTQSLQQIMPEGIMPTGTGECCLPKLLHYAATHNLKPLAIAEFWWERLTAKPSPVDQEKISGQFYGACTVRCQPLLGFLLSGFSRCFEVRRESVELAKTSSPSPKVPPVGGHGGGRGVGVRAESLSNSHQIEFSKTSQSGFSALFNLPIVYEDQWLIVVNKPAGLLSVPGRASDRQDSVLSRLRCSLPDGNALVTVHRLDQETSGLLVLARDRSTYKALSQQFQQQRIHKCYEAVLSGRITVNQGVINLPLWGNPEHRPRQSVDWQRGKPSQTCFQVLSVEGEYMRLILTPKTGRTHQLRVHASDSQGLGVPILGDRFYGCQVKASRLHLHARELNFQHPYSEEWLHLKTETPF